jgi:hypothetical protein
MWAGWFGVAFGVGVGSGGCGGYFGCHCYVFAMKCRDIMGELDWQGVLASMRVRMKGKRVETRG